MMKFPTEYLDRVKKRNDTRNQRRILWLGKFAFPEVNTKATKIIMVPSGTYDYYFPVIEPLDFEISPPSETSNIKTERIELGKYVYNGKKWYSVIRFGYSRFIVVDDSFIYKRHFRGSL